MIPALVLTFAAVAYRVALPFLPGGLSFMNFAPLAAIALCGAIWLPKRMAMILPMVALLLSDLILNTWVYEGTSLFSPEMFIRYAALAAVSGIGFMLRNKRSVGRIAAGSVAGSVIFYVLTNTASWIGAPEYALTFGGWVQALTVGVPGFPPTWFFFRNTLAGDLLYSLLFAGCMALAANKATAKLEHKAATATA